MNHTALKGTCIFIFLHEVRTQKAQVVLLIQCAGMHQCAVYQKCCSRLCHSWYCNTNTNSIAEFDSKSVVKLVQKSIMVVDI